TSVARQCYVNTIRTRLTIGIRRIADTDNLVALCGNSLRKQESRRQIEIIAGGSHGDAGRAIVDANLQRLLHRELVEERSLPPLIPLGDVFGWGGVGDVTN